MNRYLRSIVLVLAPLVLVTPARAFDPDARNIQIVVDIRQAGYSVQQGVQSTTESTQKQFIVVSEGLQGSIFIGDRVPNITYYQNYLLNEGYLTAAITFQEVGTGLIASARVAGDQIEVTLTPEISYQTQDGSGRIAVNRLSTSVRVPQGVPFEIGGNISKSEFESNFYRNSSGRAIQVVLTAKVLS